MLSHAAWPHRLSPSTTRLLTNTTDSGGQTVTSNLIAPSEESGIEPGPIATITGSLMSFTHDPDDDHGHELMDHHYDTDHTDLTSELDETEIRRQLLYDQWRLFFDKYDPEGFGEIPWLDLISALDDPEFRERVNTGKREVLMEKARTSNTAAITFQDFVNVELVAELVI